MRDPATLTYDDLPTMTHEEFMAWGRIKLVEMHSEMPLGMSMALSAGLPSDIRLQIAMANARKTIERCNVAVAKSNGEAPEGPVPPC